MNINLKNAVQKFFPNVPFKSVYLEAVANALDAHATNILINISMDSPKDYDSMTIDVVDNGDGFTDKNYNKFCNLLENEDEEHKGLGRLTYIANFSNVNIDSSFDGKRRTFDFNYDFKGEDLPPTNSYNPNGTHLKFTGYTKSRVASNTLTNPLELKKLILENLLPKLYLIQKELSITITLTILGEPDGFKSTTVKISQDDLPELTEEEIEISGIEAFPSKFSFFYSVKKIDTMGESGENLVVAISVDNRLITKDIFNRGKIPPDYKVIFILKSKGFIGQTDDTRETLKIDKNAESIIGKEFTRHAARILKEKIPAIEETNKKAETDFVNKYPHLSGLYDPSYVGIINEKKALEDAESEFLKLKKEILNASEIDDEVYEKALNVSSRALGEYIIYRTKIIEKLKKIDSKDIEGKIHDIIIPRNRHFSSNTFIEDINVNNAWLIDDKFMSYTHIFSDMEMKKILSELQWGIENIYKPDRRPDIAIVTSENPDSAEKFEVVIIELKRLDLDVKRNRDVIEQLKQRARNLLQLYPDKISRIWFYGIVDFDQELEDSVFEDHWIQLYAKDKIYYKRQPIVMNNRKKGEADMFLLSYKTIWLDAEHRNETFLKILKNGFKKEIIDKIDK